MANASSAAGSKATLPELTLRGIIIGGLITLIFTAANVYLGLKVGLTFATSIPAAVISMAVLRHFKGHNIKENNIVQPIASAAGTLSAIIFVLPGLVMVGYWQGFGLGTRSFDLLLGDASQPVASACVAGRFPYRCGTVPDSHRVPSWLSYPNILCLD